MIPLRDKNLSGTLPFVVSGIILLNVVWLAPLATFSRVRKLSVNCKKLAGHYKGGDFVIEAVTKGNIGGRK